MLWHFAIRVGLALVCGASIGAELQMVPVYGRPVHGRPSCGRRRNVCHVTVLTA